MPRYSLSLLLLLSLLAAAPALKAQQPPPNPTIDGYLSRLESQSRFEVDGRLVETTERTGNSCLTPPNGNQFLTSNVLELSDHLLIFGKYNRKQAAVRATAVCRLAWPAQKVAGAALVEKVDGDRLLVDGRVLQVDAQSTLKFESPRHALGEARQGDWVRYTAVAQPNGRYRVEALTLASSTITKRQQSLLDKTFLEFTPPDPSARKAGEVKFAHLGRRFKLPADDGLDRVQRVGASLVPAWQRALPTSDPLRIDFRFYSIAGTKVKDCFEFARGVIFMPVEVSGRLNDDKELAAVLSTCVGNVMEREAAALAPKAETNEGVLLTGLAAGMFIPGVGLAAAGGSSIYAQHLATMAREEGDRVGLDLIEEAGISPEVAPHAYEHLENKQGTPKPGSQPSSHAAYLYSWCQSGSGVALFS